MREADRAVMFRRSAEQSSRLGSPVVGHRTGSGHERVPRTAQDIHQLAGGSVDSVARDLTGARKCDVEKLSPLVDPQSRRSGASG